MADQEQDVERTEPASERRIQKAREDGQVIFSRDLVTFLLFASGCFFIRLFQDNIFLFCKSFFNQVMFVIQNPDNAIQLTYWLKKAVFFF